MFPLYADPSSCPAYQSLSICNVALLLFNYISKFAQPKFLNDHFTESKWKYPVEKILTCRIACWFGNCIALDESSMNCLGHHWTWASFPPGHLHQTVPKEDMEGDQRPSKWTAALSHSCLLADRTAVLEHAQTDFLQAAKLLNFSLIHPQ